MTLMVMVIDFAERSLQGRERAYLAGQVRDLGRVADSKDKLTRQVNTTMGSRSHRHASVR